jgi:hypothetical protein
MQLPDYSVLYGSKNGVLAPKEQAHPTCHNLPFMAAKCTNFAQGLPHQAHKAVTLHPPHPAHVSKKICMSKLTGIMSAVLHKTMACIHMATLAE